MWARFITRGVQRFFASCVSLSLPSASVLLFIGIGCSNTGPGISCYFVRRLRTGLAKRNEREEKWSSGRVHNKKKKLNWTTFPDLGFTFFSINRNGDTHTTEQTRETHNRKCSWIWFSLSCPAFLLQPCARLSTYLKQGRKSISFFRVCVCKRGKKKLLLLLRKFFQNIRSAANGRERERERRRQTGTATHTTGIESAVACEIEP